MSVYIKLFKAKKEIEAITKDSKNPFFKSKYFDINKLLAEIEPVIQKHDLLLLQPIQDNKVLTEIFDIETGEKVFSEMNLPNITDPQKLGSAITYYRRYTLQSLLGLQAEDDDGNKASKKESTDRMPSLSLEGFNFLKRQGTKEQIQTALNERRMSTEERKELTNLLNKK